LKCAHKGARNIKRFVDPRKAVGRRFFSSPSLYLHCHHIAIWFLIYERIREGRCCGAPCPGYVPDQASMTAVREQRDNNDNDDANSRIAIAVTRSRNRKAIRVPAPALRSCPDAWVAAHAQFEPLRVGEPAMTSVCHETRE